MQGMCRHTGKPLSGHPHMRQRIQDLFTTPKATRVMRRAYGGVQDEVIDAPANAGTLINIFASAAQVLDQWEPEFKLSQVSVKSLEAGHAILDLFGTDTTTSEVLTLEGIKV